MYAVVHTPTLDPPNTRGRGRSATSLGWRVMTSQPTIPAGLSAGTVPDAADEPAEEVDLATETPQERLARFERDALPLLDRKSTRLNSSH